MTNIDSVARKGSQDSTSAEEYIKIARGLKNAGKYDLALGIISAALDEFPKNLPLFLVEGEIYIQKFSKGGLDPANLKKALVSFSKVLQVDANNYFALFAVSQIYLKGGLFQKAKVTLTRLRKIAPLDKNVLLLLEIFKEKAPVELQDKPKEKKTDSLISSLSGASADSDIIVVDDSIIDKGVDSGTESAFWSNANDQVIISNIGEDSQSDQVKRDTFSDKTTVFSKLDDLNSLFLIDPQGLPFKSVNKDKKKGYENTIPSLAYNLYQVSVNGIRRASLGSFQQGELQLPVIGTIIIVNLFYALLVLVVKSDYDKAVIDKRIARYIQEVSS